MRRQTTKHNEHNRCRTTKDLKVMPNLQSWITADQGTRYTEVERATMLRMNSKYQKEEKNQDLNVTKQRTQSHEGNFMSKGTGENLMRETTKHTMKEQKEKSIRTAGDPFDEILTLGIHIFLPPGGLRHLCSWTALLKQIMNHPVNSFFSLDTCHKS